MNGLKRRMIMGFGCIILLVVVLLEAVFLVTVHRYYLNSATEALQTRASTSAKFYNQYFLGYTLRARAKYVLEHIPREEPAKIEIIDRKHRVVMDSFGASASGSVDTPDVRQALRGETGVWIGAEAAGGERLIAISNPLEDTNQTIVGVLRYTVSAEPLYAVLNRITWLAIGVGGVVVLLSFAVSLIIAKRMITPIKELDRIVREVAKGNLSNRATKRFDDEVGRLAEAFNYMADELGKNERLQNEFISSISHELRTPLTSIKGWSETILSGDLQDRQETKLGLEVISRETDRLIGLVEELLDFSRYQSGAMKINLKPVDLTQVLGQIRQQFAHHDNPKGVHYRFIWVERPCLMLGDENRLKQVMVNLLDNAYKFSRPEGEIELSMTAHDDRIQIQVSDTGEGIHPEDLPQIQEKFYKGRSKKPGSGLGLSICSQIVHMHRGSMEVISQMGVGTMVHVTFPRLEQQAGPEEKTDEKFPFSSRL